MQNCKIIKHILTLSSNGSWSKEINLVSWFEGTPKYDIRDWSKDHSFCTKGILLTEEEYKNLISLGAEKEIHNKIEYTTSKNYQKEISNTLEYNNIENLKEAKPSLTKEQEIKKPNIIITREEEYKLKKMTFNDLNKYLVTKYGKNFTEKWTLKEKEIYYNKDPNPNYNNLEEIDYFSGDENPANPFIWEEAGKLLPIIPISGSGVYRPRDKR